MIFMFRELNDKIWWDKIPTTDNKLPGKLTKSDWWIRYIWGIQAPNRKICVLATYYKITFLILNYLHQLGTSIWIEYDCNWGWSVIFDEFFLILANEKLELEWVKDFNYYIELLEEMLEEKNV